jgi:iron complex outermembrane receptor protein
MRLKYRIILLCTGCTPAWPAFAQASPSQQAAIGAAQQQQPAADAAQTPPSSGEIVVTAQRRSQRLQDVPATVTAFRGETLQERHIDRPDQMFSQVPGLTLQSPSGSAGFPIYNIRGVALLDFSYTSESPVAVYVDDVYQGNTALFAQPLYDLERVEVLKGPQGTLYGRNTTGGLVHFISKRPTADFEGNAYASYGRFDEVTLGGAVSGPLSKSIRARLAGQFTRDSGWQTNAVDGNKFGKTDHNVSLRAQVEADVASGATLRIIGDYTDAEGVNDLRALKGFRDPTNLSLTCSNDRVLANQCVNGVGFHIANPDPLIGYSNHSPADVGYAVKLYGLAGYLTWKFGFGTLTAISAYKHGQKRDATDLDAAAVSSSSLLFSTAGKHDQYSQELRLNGNAGRVNWLLGGFYYHDKRFYGNGLPDLHIGNWSHQKINSVAAYADLTWHVTDTVNLTGGARYTHDEKSIDLHFVTNPVIGTEGGHNVFTFDDSIKAAKVTWRAVADWHVTPAVMLYASAATGFKSGGYNTTTVTSPTTAGPVRPETNTQYEMGVKSTLFDHRLTANVAVYYIKWEDIQATATVASTTPGTPIVSLYQNIGTAHIHGIDGEFAFRPVPDLNLSAGFSLNHNRLSSPSTISIGGIPLNGKRLANTPGRSLNGAIDWRPGLGNGTHLIVSADASYQSSKYFRPDNVFYSQQLGYTLVNGRLGWESTGGRYKVFLFGQNLLDKKYFVSATTEGTAAVYQWGRPRTYGIEFDTKF